MKDPYAVLGLDKSASPDLLKARYKELRELYGEQRFKSGEEGNEGARKLQELEDAWHEISSDLETIDKTIDATDFGAVDSLIRQGKYNEAQDILDSITDRKGEWHYMQAIVFYKREWLSEAKTQLEMALREEPNNEKYRSSLDKLNMAINGTPINNGGERNQDSAYGNNGGNNNPPPYVEQPQGQPADMSNCLSSCCCAYCLTDCLCNAMRCC